MKRIAVLALLTLVGCAGAQSKTLVGGNLFAQWRPTRMMLAADPDLQPVRYTHAESMQLGSYVSMVLVQVGEAPPELVTGSLTTQAGPVNAALGAGGLIGAAIMFNPDPDETSVSGTSSSDADARSKSRSRAGSKSSSQASQKQSQRQSLKKGGGHGGGD